MNPVRVILQNTRAGHDGPFYECPLPVRGRPGERP